MRNRLENQLIILTGASGGIGRELCKLLVLKYRANVIGIGRSEEKMLTLREELGENANRFSYRLFDVSDKACWEAFRAELQAKKLFPYVLINNAAAFPSFRKATDTPSETTESILQSNFFSIVYAVESLFPLLTANGKSKPAVFNICSSAALCTVAGTSAYSASKAAVKGYTEALQLEESKVHIGIIYPGTTATDLFRNDENTKNSALDKIAMPAPKMAKKIAKAILRRKKRAVVGWDAKLMSFTAKVAPVKGVALIRYVMKKSKSKVFKEVFDYKE